MANRFLSNIKINDAYTFPASDGTNGQVIKTDGSGNLSFAQLAADSASVMYKDTFTGNGSTTAFTLANALNDEVQSNIYIDGVYQSKSTYSVSGTTITFSTAPLSGHEIEVISTTGINSGPTAIYTDTFTANGSATAFTLGQTVHSENQTIVFLNGVYQFKDTYTLSGTTLTLDTAPANGVSIEVMSIGSAYSGGDILYDHDFTSAGLMTTNGSGVYSITTNNSANWNTAYGWGDHSTQSYATQSYVGTQISNLVDSSPATLDTLNELAAALGDDPNFATTTATSIGLKAPLASPSFTGVPSFNLNDGTFTKAVNATNNVASTNIWGYGLYEGGSKLAEISLVRDGSNNQMYIGTTTANQTLRIGTANKVTALTINASQNATFAGTVQTTQITATNGLNYLKRNTDASLQLRSENTRSGLFITKPATDTVMGSALVLADESYRLGTANYYHMVMLQNGNTYFNQNVGIGTTSPGNKLTIASGTGGGSAPDSRTLLHIDKNGEAYISINSPAESFNGIRLNVAGSPKAFMELYDNTAQGKKLNIGTVDARDLVFDTGNQPKMTILSGGNVGIGVTGPVGKIHVGLPAYTNEDTNSQQAIFGASNGYGVRIGYNETDNKGYINVLKPGVAWGSLILQEDIGKVGIGTDAPSSKLHVVDGNNYAKLGDLHSNSTMSLRMADNSGFPVEVQAYGTELRFNTATTTGATPSVKMNILSNGNVGIGTTSPTGKFNSYISATRQLTHNGNGGDLSIISDNNNSPVMFIKGTGSADLLNVFDNTTEVFTILDGGNVGIGTTSPPAKLSVYAGGADGIQLLDISDANNSGRVFYARTNGGSWCIMNNATNYSIRSGGVPGSTSGTEKIRLTGYSATSWTSGSDETIKENIRSIGNVLDKINDYRCVEYNLIDDETRDKKIGFIAQDWQEDFPQIIEQMEDEKIGMKYTETIPILLKAIQELKADNDSLKARIETLENN